MGRHSGAALIGRPLDIRAQVLLAAGEDASSLCLSADVFYGDGQVGGVRTQVLQTVPGAEATLRIQVAQPVNEPVVTVFVRAGCQAPFTRRYVLLADPVSEPAVATAPSAAELPLASALNPPSAPEAGPLAGTPPAAAAAPVANRSSTSPRQPAGRNGLGGARTGAAARADAPASRGPRAPGPVAAAPSGPRLQLEPLDLSLPIERDPTLRLTLSLLSEPSASQEARQAAGLLWKALNAPAEDLMRELQKLAVLEAEVQGLRQEDARSQAMVAELRARLDDAEQGRWLTYGLGFMLLLSLLAVAVMVHRLRVQSREAAARAPAWWNEEVAQRPLTESQASEFAAKAPGVDIDLDLAASDFRASSLAPLSQPAALAPNVGAATHKDSPRDFAPSALGGGRSVATEELFDVQQQADFFISLGEDEQAIQVLRNHLAESPVPSPLAFLDLLSLYHRLGRRHEYEALRDRFNEVCNAGAPRFEHFSNKGLGLEGYASALGRIQALWPQPRVLDVIEQSLFRDPNDSDGEVFDLEAYRELLLLHALAKEIIRREHPDEVAAEKATPNFHQTRIQPLKAAPAMSYAAGAGLPTQPQDLPPPSANLGLDVNLDELAELSAFEASLPEVAVKVQPTSQGASSGAPDAPVVPSNLIDFEVLDFLNSSGSAEWSSPGDTQPADSRPPNAGKSSGRA